MIYLGDFPVNSTIYVPFNTFSSVGASVTITGLAVTDIEIYKDGSATQRASDAGYTLLDTDGIDFDGITGIHGFSIDLSDNTDAGFYAAGHEYWIVVASITCDGQTVNFVAGTFSIDRWYNQAITRGQVKITANAANEGALDIRNSNAGGHGTLNDGGSTGLYNSGDTYGQYNAGDDAGTYNLGTAASSKGQVNQGIAIGLYNYGDTGQNNEGTAAIGCMNSGVSEGQWNAASAAGSHGQRNQGLEAGEYNIATAAASSGQWNQGLAEGQNNYATAVGGIGQKANGVTYGIQAIGGTGGISAVGTAGDGINANGTDYGIQAVGVTGDIDPDLSPLLTGVNVTSIGNAVITAASIATDAIDADSLATDAADEIADHVWDEAIAGHLGVGSTGAALNGAGGGATVFPTGAIEFTYTVTDSSTALPLEGVEVWISTDNPAVNIVWKGDTDAFGIAMDVLGNKPKLDAGTYYFWRQLAGYTFVDPDTEIVS